MGCKFRKIIPLWVCLAALVCPAWGQYTVKGRVIDESTGESIPFATVVIGEKGSHTDMDGFYTLKDVQKGKYCILSTCVGYSNISSAVEISCDTTLETIEMSVGVGSSQENIAPITPEILARLKDMASRLYHPVETIDFLEKGYYCHKLMRAYYLEFVKRRGGQCALVEDISVADSALKYLKYTWKEDKDSKYLYYPICQVEYALGLPHDKQIRQPKRLMRNGYLKEPEFPADWMTGNQDLLSIVEEAVQNDEMTSGIDESPMWNTNENTLRILATSPWGNGWIYRLQEGTLYSKSFYYKNKGSNGRTIKLTKNLHYSLTPEEQDTVNRLMAEIARKPLRKSMNGSMVIDGPTYLVEMCRDGKYEVNRSSCSFSWSLDSLYAFIGRVMERHAAYISAQLIDTSVYKKKSFDYLSNEVTVRFKRMGDDMVVDHSIGGFTIPMPLPKGEYTVTITSDIYRTYKTTIDLQQDTDLGQIVLDRRKHLSRSAKNRIEEERRGRY